jgi:hypothetical protein
MADSHLMAVGEAVRRKQERNLVQAETAATGLLL